MMEGEKPSCDRCKLYDDHDNRCLMHGRVAKAIPCPDFVKKPREIQQNFDEFL